MRNATADGTLFKIIDSEAGEKVDLIPWTLDARYREAFDRRIRLSFEDLNGELIEAWYARPDDVVVGKLLAWDEGHSTKHQYDILAMLLFFYQKRDPSVLRYFDEKYVDKRAKTISKNVWEFWQALKKEAKRKRKV